jgi:nicotinamidase-related amidase
MGNKIGDIDDFDPNDYALVVTDVQRDYADPSISPFAQKWRMNL